MDLVQKAAERTGIRIDIDRDSPFPYGVGNPRIYGTPEPGCSVGSIGHGAGACSETCSRFFPAPDVIASSTEGRALVKSALAARVSNIINSHKPWAEIKALVEKEMDL